MEVRFHKTFIKRFKLLPSKVQKKFYQRLDLFLADPHHPTIHDHPVDKAYPGCRSINVSGDYRAIFHVQDGQTIFILIGTHSELYS